ncbi:hypothetical protein [Nonomuraea sp. NPDC003201]
MPASLRPLNRSTWSDPVGQARAIRASTAVSGAVSDEVVGEILDTVVMPLLRPDARDEREIAELKEALADAHLQLRRQSSNARP